MTKDDDIKATYQAMDISEKLDFLHFEDIEFSLPNFWFISLKPMKFIIQNEKNESIFHLESTMLQMKNYEEQRCDRACSQTFLRPR